MRAEDLEEGIKLRGLSRIATWVHLKVGSRLRVHDQLI